MECPKYPPPFVPSINPAIYNATTSSYLFFFSQGQLVQLSWISRSTTRVSVLDAPVIRWSKSGHGVRRPEETDRFRVSTSFVYTCMHSTKLPQTAILTSFVSHIGELKILRIQRLRCALGWFGLKCIEV